VPYILIMKNAARIQTLHTTAIEALDQAFEAETVSVACGYLGAALAATQELSRLGTIHPALHEAVTETKMALAARGWC
jgi:hypothetical protein